MISYTYTKHPLNLSRMGSGRSLRFFKMHRLVLSGWWSTDYTFLSPTSATCRDVADAADCDSPDRPVPHWNDQKKRDDHRYKCKVMHRDKKKENSENEGGQKKKWYQSFGEGSTKKREERTREMPIEYNLCWLIVDCECKTAVSLNIYLAGVLFPVRLRLFQKAFFFFFFYFFESSTSGEEQRERFEGLIAFLFLLFFRVLL